MMAEQSAPRIVIVGGVAGGASAATRARRVNEHAGIVMFERDEYVSFANCGLPYYVGEEIRERQSLLLVQPALFKSRFAIDVQVRHEVTAIDRAAKQVRVVDRNAERAFDVAYDKLILAPGAEPIVPPLAGVRAANVFTLRNVTDSDRIKACVDQACVEGAAAGPQQTAVVVGAGFIGLEMVEQLVRRGLRTVLVELREQVLPMFDPELARSVEVELRAKGVELHLGAGIQAIRTADGRAVGVELTNGEVCDADFVILGIGVRANVSLAQAAGLAIGATGGITVNEFQQTSDPDIYAVGDAVEYVFGPTGRAQRVALAGPANRSGRVAGEHAATGRCSTPMTPVQGTSIVRVFDVTAALTGLSAREAARAGLPAESVAIRAMHHAGYFPGAKPLWLKLTFDRNSGRVLGAQAVGQEGVDKRIDVIATAMRFGATVRDLTGLDLTYAPPFGSAKDPVHMAAFAACNILDGLVAIHPTGAALGDVQFVDVRTPKEVQELRYHGAIAIPLDELRQRIGELDASKPTIVTCASGQRSYIAARILMQRGFANVVSVTGGALLRKLIRPEDFA